MKGTSWVASIAVGLLAACGPEPVPSPPPPVPEQADCPEGFGPLAEGIENGCYKQLPDAPWIAAEESCEQFEAGGVRAHLIVVDRAVEHDLLSSWAPSTYEGIWTASLQRSARGEFRNVNWVVPDVEYWGSGEPNDYEDCGFLDDCNGGDERCMEYSHRTGLWNDEKCGDPAIVICEWDSIDPYDWRPYDNE